MQVVGLPRQITQGARLASRLCAAERSEGAHRRDALERWKQARADGLNARSAAAAVGVPLVDPLPLAKTRRTRTP